MGKGEGFFDAWRVKIGVHLKHQVVYPGNLVEGFVEIVATGPIDFTAVRVKICGKEKIICRRNESRGTGRFDEQGFEIRESYVATYAESVVVHKHLLTLAGHMKYNPIKLPSFIMPPGRYTYPFAFQLPTTVPPSFAKRADDDEADILYYVKAYVDIPMGRDAVAKSYFTVLSAMPAAQWANKQTMLLDKKWDVTLCCCIDKGKVSGRLFCDRTAIAIDRDYLLVCADIDATLSQEKVESLEISLINTLQYTAQGKTERNRLVAGHTVVRGCPILPGLKGRIQGVVPIDRNLVPTVHTYNIQSDYVIQMELNIPMASDPSHTFPVVLTQSVDMSNFLPPVNFQNPMYGRYAKGAPELCREDYYVPPPNPCYAHYPVPSCFPTGYMLPPVPVFNPFAVLPPVGLFTAPTAYASVSAQKYAPPPTASASISWTGGWDAAPASPIVMGPPPPTGLVAYGGEMTVTETRTETRDGVTVSSTTTTTTGGGGLGEPFMA